MARARLALLAAAILAVAGCLFPSFDELKQAQPATRDGGKKKPVPDEPDATLDIPPAVAIPNQVVKCGVTTCTVGTEYCCVLPVGSQCTPAANIDACPLGTLAFCDGNEDCPSGQTCCSRENDPTAVCRDSCAGTEICTSTGECPQGKSCTRMFDDGYKGCQ